MEMIISDRSRYYNLVKSKYAARNVLIESLPATCLHSFGSQFCFTATGAYPGKEIIFLAIDNLLKYYSLLEPMKLHIQPDPVTIRSLG